MIAGRNFTPAQISSPQMMMAKTKTLFMPGILTRRGGAVTEMGVEVAAAMREALWVARKPFSWGLERNGRPARHFDEY